MTQETGETRDAILEDVNKHLEKIINANKERKKLYWIVIYAKPLKHLVDGKHALAQHIKAYDTKPSPKVGMITIEINNQTGKMNWDVNMPQNPFDFNSLIVLGGKPCDELVTETTSIPGAYICQ